MLWLNFSSHKPLSMNMIILISILDLRSFLERITRNVKPSHWGGYINSSHLTLTDTFKLNDKTYCWWWRRSLGVITYQQTENLQLTEFFHFKYHPTQDKLHIWLSNIKHYIWIFLGKWHNDIPCDSCSIVTQYKWLAYVDIEAMSAKIPADRWFFSGFLVVVCLQYRT